MADTLRMALAELLRKAQLEGDIDFLREGVRVLSQALMELDVSSIWAPSGMNARPSDAGSATATANATGTRGWGRSSYRCRGSGTGTSRRPAGTPASGGTRVGGGDPGGVCARGLDAAGGRPGEGPGNGWHQQEPGVAALSELGRGGQALSHAAVHDDLSVRLAGRDLPEGAAGWAGGLGGGGDRHWRHATGEREVLGLDVGPSEDGAFWLQFLRGLVGRGFTGCGWSPAMRMRG